METSPTDYTFLLNFLDEPIFLLLLIFWFMWFLVIFLLNQNKEYVKELTRGILKSQRQFSMIDLGALHEIPKQSIKILYWEKNGIKLSMTNMTKDSYL